MSIKLTETQRAMLKAAALREDRCLPPAQSLRGAQIRKTAEKLIEAGLVREVKAKPLSPVWRHDDQSGSAFALKLTAAGTKATAIEESGPRRPLVPKDTVASANPKPRPDRSASTPDAHDAQTETSACPHRARQRQRRAAIRQQDRGRDWDARAGGGSDDRGTRVATTGWLPHTTRAALTGLRKRGYVLAVDRSNRERGSVYRIEAKPGEDKSRSGKDASRRGGVMAARPNRDEAECAGC